MIHIVPTDRCCRSIGCMLVGSVVTCPFPITTHARLEAYTMVYPENYTHIFYTLKYPHGFYIYFCQNNKLIYADEIEPPWSRPERLVIGC